MDSACGKALSRGLRAAVALALLVLPATPVAPALAQSMLPAARAWMGVVEPAFEVRALTMEQHAGRERLRVEVTLARPVRVAGTVVMPHPRGRAHAELPLAQAWQAPLLMALLLLAWPAPGGTRERAVRALLALPAVTALLALDAPLVLLAEIWQLLRQAHGDQAFHAIVAWSELLRAGGRAGLGLVVAAAVLWLAGRRSRSSG